MGLSEREQRVLEELERGLYADDAKFATKVSNGPSNSAAKVVGGALLGVVGISVLVFAVISQVTLFGVVGFALMLGGVLIATSSNGRVDKPKVTKRGGTSRPVSPGAAKDAPKGNFFEDRWNKRMDE
jgi:hypothetical protein